MALSSSLRGVVKVAAAAADTVRRPAPGVVVLIYHRVGARSGQQVDLPAGLFDEQLAWLAAERRVVPLGDALALLAGPGAAGGTPSANGPSDGAPVGLAGDELPVVVTFDDGTADFVDEALPLLVRHGIPATLYVATDFVEAGRAFPDDGVPVSWAGLREACATGLVDVGSHTHTHRLLDRTPLAEAVDELDRSVELVADRLGTPPLDFAYPKAVSPSPDVEAAVRARFRSAALAGSRANRPGATDVHRLARTPVQRSDGMRWFVRKAGGGMAGEDAIRRLLNRRRYATATT